jgi:hypothetical protein
MEFTQISARIWKEQLEIIEKAAEKLSNKLGEKISVAEYVRRKIMPHAFADAGVPPKEFPPFQHGKHGLASHVAAKLGMPRLAWERAILERAAAAALKELNEEEPPSDREVPRTRSDSRALSPQGGMPVAKKRQTR